jgi:hemerythrin-like domain-containing protein
MQTTTSMRATQILRAEHEVILKVLDCLERVADGAASAGVPDLLSAKEILEFLAVFADRCHHGKEEECLFPKLFDQGMPRHVGPVAVMLAEHEEGRSEVAGMRAALAACEQGKREATEQFVAHARSYVQLLREHIAKENEVLFPMADGMLGEVQQQELLTAFGKVERHDMGEGTHERYLALAEGLVSRLGVKPGAHSFAQAGACCSHGHRH